MNTRDYKQFSPGCCYHIYNRSNDKRDIFLDDDDYGMFMLRLKQNLFPESYEKHRTPPLPTGSFSLVAYSLMPNHFHLKIRQNGDVPITKLMLRLCTSYSKYFNKRHDRIGHLFQDRYKTKLIDSNKYLLWVSAYIHLNSKLANPTVDPISYKWSSLGEYARGEDGICEKSVILKQFGSPREYLKFVEESYQPLREKKLMDKELKELGVDLG